MIARWNRKQLVFNPMDFIDDATLESNQVKVHPISYWLGQKKIMINLIIMTSVWIICVFDYYLINFRVIHFENVYSIVLTSQISEMGAAIFAGILFKILGVKKSLMLSFGLAGFGGVIIIFYGLNS